MIEAFGVIAFLLSICSFVCIIVGLIKPAAFTSLFKKNLGRKKTSLVFAGITLALFVIGVVSAINSPTSSTESPQKNSGQVTNDTATVKPSITSTPTPSITGLNITRAIVMNRLQNADPTLNFQPSTPVNGIERYMAGKGQNEIELYGNADNLIEVTSTALLGDNSGDNLSALVYVVGVATTVDKGSSDWIATTMKEISNGWNNGQNTVEKSTVVNGKKFDIVAKKSDVFNIVSLTIYSAQESEPPTTEHTEAGPTQAATVITANKATSESSTYHAPATNISGFPGLTKVLIKASIVTGANGMTFTNDETDQWDSCIDTINPDSGASNWYEYDFGNMSPGQSVTIRWNQLTREDDATFIPSAVAHGTSVIELSCDLDTKTVGFASFLY